MTPPLVPPSSLSIPAAVVGVGMIFDETYRPFFEQPSQSRFMVGYDIVDVRLAALGSRTGDRAANYRAAAPARTRAVTSYSGGDAVAAFLRSDVVAVCVATPDDRHFPTALAAIRAGKHVLIEKPSVLTLAEWQTLSDAAAEHSVLVKVVYHKLLDPDHKKLRTLSLNGSLDHVNFGYCTLFEPRSISRDQFAQWIVGRNPATYVAVHYYKLIDFTFATDWKLDRITATGQRGIVRAADSSTWDSVQVQVVYRYSDGREAAFDIHTCWVSPDNSPGYVDQEVQFHFDNASWSAHQRRRGVELVVDGKTPTELKENLNNHYNSASVEPWGENTQRGYGIEAVRRFFEEVAHVECGGPPEGRGARLAEMAALAYNDIAADRNVVAVTQAVEAILEEQAVGRVGCVVFSEHSLGDLVLFRPGDATPRVLQPSAST
jgi:D-galacturonate reductase